MVENDVNIVDKIYKYLLDNNIVTYKIISNKNEELFTDVDGKKYTLLLANGILKYEVKFDEFLPEIIQDIVQTNNRSATSISKYAATWRCNIPCSSLRDLILFPNNIYLSLCQ